MNWLTSRASSLFKTDAAGGDPARDWRVLLALASIAFVLILGWNVWAFETVVNGGTLGVAAPPAPSATTSALDSISGVLSDRAAEDEKYVSGAYSYADPSL